MQFLCTFRKTWWLRMLKTLSKQQICCRGCFFEEIKAIGVEKMHQILTEIDQTKKIQILKTSCSFCVILKSLGGFEFQRRSTKNNLVVRMAFLANKPSFVMKKKTHNLRTKMTMTSKCTDFSRFDSTFVNFLKIAWIGTSNTFNHERFRCPIGLFAEINAVL